MGYFYFDESIHTRGGFILGAWVYSKHDLTPKIFDAIAASGLRPGTDEYKSGKLIKNDERLANLRYRIIRALVPECRIGVVVHPSNDRNGLCESALHCLWEILECNSEIHDRHSVYIDEGIRLQSPLDRKLVEGLQQSGVTENRYECDSRRVAGIQAADLAAHTCAIMLLDEMGMVEKKVRIIDYEPDNDIELGFEMWARLRHCFFVNDRLFPDCENDPAMEAECVMSGLHIASACSLRLAMCAQKRFGTVYLGCIH